MRQTLAPIYGTHEAQAMIRLIFHSLKNWDAAGLIMHEPDELSDYILDKIDDIMRRLQNHEPIQYILGEGYFYGMYLKVTPDVLIPRPETEQLVHLIVDENKSPDLSVLDIGTGSGAIAIALSRNLNFPQITALDISGKALAVAKENASRFKAKIDFIEEDIFKYSPKPESLDIIVSNPPYITESEKKTMERNVLDYEPASALFVPDENPLLFYSRIATVASSALKPDGRLYFEINPLFSNQLINLLSNDGFTDIMETKDAYGKRRFISCKRPG